MVKKRILPAFVFFAECVLIFLYSRHAKTFISPGKFIRSFSWSPVSGPFELAPFLGILTTQIAALLVFASWMTLASLMGLCLLKRLGYSAKSLGQRLLIACRLGLGVLSLSVFALGLFHLLYPLAALLLAIAGIIYCAVEMENIYLLPHIRNALKPGRFFEEVHDPIIMVTLLLCVIVALFHFLGALLPPSSFDEMDYQLALPKLYALNHALINTPFNHLSYLPKNMSMLFTLGLLSGSAMISKLFSLAFGIMASVALYLFGREKIGQRAAALGAISFFLIPVIGNQMRNAVADLGTGFYEILGIFFLLQWLEIEDRPTLFLSSIFFGLALGSKYTAMLGFAAGFAIIAFHPFQFKKRRATSLLIFMGPAALLFIPTLAWNFYQTGNPLTPILSSIIHSRNFFYAGHYKPLVDYASGKGIPDYFPIYGPKDVLMIPWRLFVWHNNYNHDLGAAILVGLPLALLSLKEKLSPWFKNLALIAGLYWLSWIAIPIHISRYFVAGLGLTSLIFGWIVSSGLNASRWRWVLFAPILLALTEQGMRMVAIQNIHKDPWGYLSGRTSLADYLDAILMDTPYGAEDFANHNIPKDSTILVFDEFRTFYLNRKFIAATPWDHELWHELVHKSKNGKELSDRLRALGITHFLANDNYLRGHSGFSWADPWTPEERLRSARFIAYRMKRLYTSPTEVWLAQIK
jgi:hypothetical protein